MLRAAHGQKRAADLGKISPLRHPHLHPHCGRPTTLGNRRDQRHLPQIPMDRKRGGKVHGSLANSLPPDRPWGPRHPRPAPDQHCPTNQMVVAAASRREQGLDKPAHRSIQGSAGLLQRLHVHHTQERPLHGILEGRWIQGQTVKDVAPSLLEFVNQRDIKMTIVAAGLAGRAWVRQISRGITTSAILDYLRLWDLVSQIQLGDNEDSLI